MAASFLCWLATAAMTLALAACGTDKPSGHIALYDSPGPAARMVTGRTTQAEVQALLGTPDFVHKGAFNCCGEFVGSALGVIPPGAPGQRWDYYASRYQELGFGLLTKQRGMSRTLSVVFDASGVVHDVTVRDNDGLWYSKPWMRMM